MKKTTLLALVLSSNFAIADCERERSVYYAWYDICDDFSGASEKAAAGGAMGGPWVSDRWGGLGGLLGIGPGIGAAIACGKRNKAWNLLVACEDPETKKARAEELTRVNQYIENEAKTIGLIALKMVLKKFEHIFDQIDAEFQALPLSTPINELKDKHNEIVQKYLGQLP